MISDKYAVLIYGRNEAKNIPVIFKSLDNQTIKPIFILYLDDVSRDNTFDVLKEEIKKYPYLYCSWLFKDHVSYVGKKELSITVNELIFECDLLRRQHKIDSFMISGGDIVFSPSYCENIILEMKKDSKLVLCSGRILNESYNVNFPRGAGRFHKILFWDRYIKKLPFSYIWESYPVYKALSLGYHVKAFKNNLMFSLRPTTDYKSDYGRAMRELGYFPFYAFAKCFLGFLKDRKKGVNMLRSYLKHGSVYDMNIQRYVRQFQIGRMRDEIKYRLRKR